MTPAMQPFIPFLDVENSRTYTDGLYSSDPDKCLESIICIKNSVIGSNKQKGSIIAQGIVPRLMQLLSDISASPMIRLESAVILGSLARGNDTHVSALSDQQIIPLLMRVLESESNSNLVSACLRCLRSLAEHNHTPNIEGQTSKLLLQYAMPDQPTDNRVCIATIISVACKNYVQQDALCEANAAPILTNLLNYAPDSLITPTLNCLAAFARDHVHAASSLEISGASDLLSSLVQRSRASEIQLRAAKCLAYLHRAGALSADDPRLVYKALPCLARLCHREQELEIRCSAADALAYLAEVDTDLQRIASISYHLINELAELLSQKEESARQAAFKAFATLGANDEAIRKRIIDTDNLMERLVAGLGDSNAEVRLAAVRCLHSLSRSVQQLRTTFQDHCVWEPLMALLTSNPCDELLTVGSSTLCNLLLEFSPAKEPILEQGAVKMLCGLTERPEPALRLNGVWALMNMAFQAEQRVKTQILSAMGTERIFRLLGDSDARVLMKTLGLLRNLLSTRSHIDTIMSAHSAQIMQAVVLVLESPHSSDVKEQALCILGNIGDGERAKEHIMANEDVLKKLTDYMMHTDTRLQAAAIFCIGNLARRGEAGATERQARLRALGVFAILQQLASTHEPVLFDKVKAAMNEFLDDINK